MLCPICDAINPDNAAICATCGTAFDEVGEPEQLETLPVGARLRQGDFTIGRMIGQGGFGITYLGSSAREGSVVAIKEFFPVGCYRRGLTVQPSLKLRDDFPTGRQKFIHEAHTLVRFASPRIVNVFTSFEENNTAYMVMEYLQGKTLLQLTEERGALPESLAIRYIMEVGEAVSVIHQFGLLHRDIKPENVIVGDDGRVVLFDLGTARAFAAGLTKNMTAMLTPGYAPLEQYGRNARFGIYTDVYGMGATLYHLLTGEMPIPAADRAGGEELVPPERLNPHVSHATSSAVMWAMEMRIDARPQTVAEFLAALRRAPRRVTSQAAAYDAPTATSPTATPAPSPSVPASPAPQQWPPVPNKAPAQTVMTAPYQDVTLPHHPDTAEIHDGRIASETALFKAEATRLARHPLAPPPRTSLPTAAGSGATDVTVPIGHLAWPKKCACCLQPNDSLMRIAFLQRLWYVPYCQDCLDHASLWRDAVTTFRFGLGLAAFIAVVGVIMEEPYTGVLGALLALLFSFLYQRLGLASATRLIKPTCCSHHLTVSATMEIQEEVTFHFVNPEYAEEFRAENEPPAAG